MSETVRSVADGGRGDRDSGAAEITAFWDPSDHGYPARMTVPFGKPLPIPAPFGIELETTDFVDEPEEDQEETAE